MNHRDTKTQSIEDMVNHDLNELFIDIEGQKVVLNIIRGLDDVKQGNFSDKTILDIVESD
ncbi:MAG TPA: hypothetical protein EYG66_03835 [Mariprofundaceae bacterium]|nr:hypothetical protein [Mariprofundaceae bacterium]